MRRLVLMVGLAALAGCGSSVSASPSAASGPAHFRQGFLAFAGCMRSHGLPSYPDPKFSISSDGLQVRISPGKLDPNSSEFQTADQACHHLMPDGGTPRTGASTYELAQDNRFAACMRLHGVFNFPDPDHDGVFTLPSGVDQQSPVFHHAMSACRDVTPNSLSLNQSEPPG